MRSPTNWGDNYTEEFDAIFPDLAKEHGLIFYPFFLDGVVFDAKLNQQDGIHPNAKGVAAIVKAILPPGRGADRQGRGAARRRLEELKGTPMPRLFTGIEIPGETARGDRAPQSAAAGRRAGPSPRTCI